MNLRRPWRGACLALAATGLGVAQPACADVWGFQDAVDLSDAGDAVGAGAPDSPDAPPDARCNDSCVPAAPAGWQGPIAIFEGTGGPPPPAPPACAGAYSLPVYDGNATPSAPASSCTCSCGAPDVTCSEPVATFFSDPGCTISCGTPDQPSGASCTVLSLGMCVGTHIKLSSPEPTGGSCAPQASSVTKPPEWGSVARLCAPASAPAQEDCAEGNVCAPAPGLPFEPGTYCVARSGMWSCPSGYPASRTYFESFTDTRDCSACTCGAPTGATCASTVTTFNDPGCNGAGTSTFAAPESCANLGGAKSATFSSSVTGGACLASGGEPEGNFTATTPTTICCSQ